MNLLLLISPLYMLQVYDRVLPAASFDTLLYLSLLAVAGLTVLGALEIIRSLYSNRVAARIDKQFGAIAFMGAMNGSKAGFGDVQPLRDLAAIRNFVSSRLLSFLFDLPFGPLFVCLLYLVHPMLFLVTLAGGLVMVAIAVLNQIATSRLDKSASDALGTAMNSAQSFAKHAETVRALGMSGHAIEHWGSHFASSLGAADQVARINAYFGGASRTVRMMLQSVTLGVGAYLVMANEMTAGMIFASSIISGRALQPLDQIIGSWRQIVEAGRAWKRLSALVADAQTTPPSDLTVSHPRESLSAEAVIYVAPHADPGSSPLIRRVSFSISPGETVAMIGPSQAGKSTLARLVVGAISPRSGVIRFNGTDLRNWDADKLGKLIGYMPQEVELFPGTIAQNIARFDPHASDDAILEAARFAHVHDLIASQSAGYQTVIAPNGIRLSGGERQRIGLARAFYGRPRLLVLDEPNASLDAEGDAALDRSIADAKARGSSVILITHRPSLAQTCDRIMMLRDGQIEFFGPAFEVLRRLARPVMTAAAGPSNLPQPAQAEAEAAMGAAESHGASGRLPATVAATNNGGQAKWSMRSSYVAVLDS